MAQSERADAPVRAATRGQRASPLLSESRDGVVATSLVGCLPNLQFFLREIHLELKPGGVAIRGSFGPGIFVTIGTRAVLGAARFESSGHRPPAGRWGRNFLIVSRKTYRPLARATLGGFVLHVALWERMGKPRPTGVNCGKRASTDKRCDGAAARFDAAMPQPAAQRKHARKFGFVSLVFPRGAIGKLASTSVNWRRPAYTASANLSRLIRATVARLL